MADNTKIEWCDASWNPIRARNRESGRVGWFCVHKSPGCKFCYAEPINRRLGTGVDYKAQNLAEVEVFLDENMLTQPLRWKKPRAIFPCSMTDLFGEFVPEAMIDRVFAIMALCPQHVFIVLTKRSARMRDYMRTPNRKRTIAEQVLPISDALACAGGHSARVKLDHFSACFAGSAPHPNVWLGISCEDQPRADERIPDLLATPAAVRLISAEPLLGPVDLARYLAPRSTPNGDGYGGREGPGFSTDFTKLDWVIAGGESGPRARPMCAAWARDIRDQCAAAGVSFFFKQWGQYAPRKVNEPHDTLVRREDGAHGRPGAVHGVEIYPMRSVGKKAAGRLLDGRTHDERPSFAPQELFS